MCKLFLVTMSEVTLIFPHQLFQQHPALVKNRQVYLVEEWLFFRQYNFHKQKLILHRSAMKGYEAFLKENNLAVEYISTTDIRNDVRELIASLQQQKITSIHIANVTDYWLLKRITQACDKHAISLTVHASPSFLNSMNEVADYFDKRKTYFQTDFYISQRKKRKLLLKADGKPEAGKWTFDAENREKFPKKETAPTINFPPENSYITEAKEYVQKHFAANYGSAEAPHFFVSGYKESEDWLNDFLKNRFEKFGVYEDAIVASENILHHSVLTPMLNTGLLTPQQILEAVIKYAGANNIPLNSLEGFVRQIVGWRELYALCTNGKAANNEQLITGNLKEKSQQLSGQAKLV